MENKLKIVVEGINTKCKPGHFGILLQNEPIKSIDHDCDAIHPEGDNGSLNAIVNNERLSFMTKSELKDLDETFRKYSKMLTDRRYPVDIQQQVDNGNILSFPII